MEGVQKHLRNKLLAGALAAVPVIVIVYGAIWLEQQTEPLSKPLGIHFPGLGILIAIVGVYLLGVIVTSLLGRFLLRIADRLLLRVPGLNHLYRAWKDVLAAPTSKQGVYDQVVLLPNLDGKGAQLGFHSGETIPGDTRTLCVFVPGSPNPIAGRLVLVRPEECVPLSLSLEDAFKFLLSTGNYVPAGLHGISPLPVEKA